MSIINDSTQLLINNSYRYLGRLGYTIIRSKRLNSNYGSSLNTHILTVSKHAQYKQLILKIASTHRIQSEYLGTQKLENYIPVPKIRYYERFEDDAVLLRDYFEGLTFAELIHNLEIHQDLNSMLQLEMAKEKKIIKLYQYKKEIKTADYKNLITNTLFLNRLNGSRYLLFYKEDSKITNLANKHFIINGLVFPYSINNIFQEIRTRLSNKENCKHIAYLSHGDAHHGNIIYTPEEEIFFIDPEYADYIPPLMELAKPYYNDLLGCYFYYYQEYLEHYFNTELVRVSANTIELKINTNKSFIFRIELTKVKLQSRKEYLNREDFLNFNDYLFLCHTLTKNPNQYTGKTLMLFLAFSFILFNFDPFKPESILKFIK